MRSVPVGLLERDRAVVHAERVGQERLAEEVAREVRFELELQEIVVEVVHDVGFAEAHPASRLAGELQPVASTSDPSRPPIKTLVVPGGVVFALGAVQLGRASAIDRTANALPAGRQRQRGGGQERDRLQHASPGLGG